MGQGAKPGIGGHLRGKDRGRRFKNENDTRGTGRASPAPHHDIYPREDLRQLVYSAKEATQKHKARYEVKVAAVHNYRGDSKKRHCQKRRRYNRHRRIPRGGTGAAPTRIRDNVGIPIEACAGGS